jgi:ligand-binding SRPBCC domain-containing protein
VIRIEIPVDVARPVQEVFAYVTDLDRLGEWQPNVVSVTKQTDGPMGRGTRLREVRRGPFGRRIEAIVEISAYEPNRRFDLRIVSGPLPIDGGHEFRETEDGTRIDFVAHGQPTGVLRLAEPFLRGAMKRQFSGYYERLKAQLESHDPSR